MQRDVNDGYVDIQKNFLNELTVKFRKPPSEVVTRNPEITVLKHFTVPQRLFPQAQDDISVKKLKLDIDMNIGKTKNLRKHSTIIATMKSSFKSSLNTLEQKVKSIMTQKKFKVE